MTQIHKGPTRRRLLKAAAGTGFGLIAAPALLRYAAAQSWHAGDPFSLGVASGASRPDGFVLWTRLAPEPLSNNPATPGGMRSGDTTVVYEIATDPALRDVVRRGEATAEQAFAFSVHLDVRGLEPGRPYWYRFMSGDAASPIGRAATSPAPESAPERLRFGFVSCSNYEHGYFSAYRHLGVLLLGNADAESFRTELRDGLRKLGYVEGQNINFKFLSADGKFDLLPKLAAELVALRVEVIVALYTPCALAAQQATREIPVVVVSGDPVGTGLVTSLNRPGGNITGISLMAAELHGKCVELFRDMLPSVRRVAVLLNAEDPFWQQVQQQGL